MGCYVSLCNLPICSCVGSNRIPALDQELEDIRTRDVPGPPDVTKCLIDWLTKSANYSIKKLTSYNQIGWDILHVIARFIDGTPVGSNGDWKHLARLLGLHIHDIIVIINNQIFSSSYHLTIYFVFRELKTFLPSRVLL